MYTLHVSDGLSVHHQELKTAYTATVYVKQLLLPAVIAAGSSSEWWDFLNTYFEVFAIY
jgi:hypothetical protein